MASAETSLVVKDKSLTTMPRESDIVDLVKNVCRQESKREAVARAEQQEALLQSFQRLSQEVQADSRA